jgi:hypothetical protein
MWTGTGILIPHTLLMPCSGWEKNKDFQLCRGDAGVDISRVSDKEVLALALKRGLF